MEVLRYSLSLPISLDNSKQPQVLSKPRNEMVYALCNEKQCSFECCLWKSIVVDNAPIIFSSVGLDLSILSPSIGAQKYNPSSSGPTHLITYLETTWALPSQPIFSTGLISISDLVIIWNNVFPIVMKILLFLENFYHLFFSMTYFEPDNFGRWASHNFASQYNVLPRTMKRQVKQFHQFVSYEWLTPKPRW